MWTPDIVRIRFIEAADTERYLPKPFTASGKGYWPQHLYSAEDMEGWDEKAKADNASRPSTRAPDGAVTRHDECLAWTSTLIPDQTRRHLVWAYAFCRANKREFGRLCDKKGWAKRTAYDRLHKLWDRLTTHFEHEGLLLRMPSEFWVAQETPNQAHPMPTIGNIANTPHAIPFTPSFRTEHSLDLIHTQDDADQFASFLKERNTLVRKEQARRETLRRRKLGLDEAEQMSPAA